VDDEPEVLALAGSILQAEGHTTLGTWDPRETLAIARSRPEPLEHFGIRLAPGELFVVKALAVADLASKVRGVLSGHLRVARPYDTRVRVPPVERRPAQ
jgi:CheY-like chemotaxis protein